MNLPKIQSCIKNHHNCTIGLADTAKVIKSESTELLVSSHIRYDSQ